MRLHKAKAWLRRADKTSSGGFTLIELAALLLVVALGMSTVLSVRTTEQGRESRVNSKSHVDEIVAALETYASRNNRLPCVASKTITISDANFGKEVLANCVTDTSTPAGTLRFETSGGSGVYVREGAVPVYDLLLPEDRMYDEYGNRYTYAVMERMTSTTTYSAATGAITVLNGAGSNITTNAAYVVFSHGKDGKGAYRSTSGAQKAACGASTNLDVENCDGDATYRKTDYNESTTAALYYDDLFQWGDKPSSSFVSISEVPAAFYLGVTAGDNSSYSLASGDINGDGYDDMIIGAIYADPGGRSNAGSTYVVFGKASGWTSSNELSALNGTTGFRIDGVTADDNSGWSVASGDVNGDSYGDVIIGAPYADPSGRTSAGSTYVVFGKASGWTSTVALSSLNGTTGFRLDGSVSVDFSGVSTSSGDVNNDGYADVFTGALYYWGAGGGAAYSGATYVVFGKASGWASTIELSSLNGTTGSRIEGSGNEYTGRSLSNGDVNNDGYADVIIGGPQADPSGVVDAGSVFVVFGKASGWASTITLSSLNGTTGFRLNGVSTSDSAGFSLSSGDINGDTYDDVIVGAYAADPSSRANGGSTYIVFGKASGWASTIALSSLNGTTGFRLDGAVAGDQAGVSVSSGNVNNDSYVDVIVGANRSAPGGITAAGATYVLFGKASGWASTVELSSLNGTTGFRVDGTAANDHSGRNVSSGDLNNDGYADMISGILLADPGGRTDAGTTYTVFGKASGWSASYDITSLLNP